MDTNTSEYFLLSTAAEGVLLITLNDPRTLNALPHNALHEIGDILIRARDDDTVKVIVITGAGKAFCSGANVKGLSASEGVAKMALDYEADDWVYRILRCDKPVISAINGDCVGAGMSLAMLTDIRLMSDSARIGDPHVAIGLIASGSTCTWPAAIGLLRSKEHILLGDLMSAEEAYRLGLVNHIYPKELVLSEAMAIAERFVAIPQAGLRMQKRLLNMQFEACFGTLHHSALAWEALSADTADHREALGNVVTRLADRSPSGAAS